MRFLPGSALSRRREHLRTASKRVVAAPWMRVHPGRPLSTRSIQKTTTRRETQIARSTLSKITNLNKRTTPKLPTRTPLSP
jgi:hypothetical protein